MSGLDIGFILLAVMIVGYGLGLLTWFISKTKRGDFRKDRIHNATEIDSF